MGTRINPCHGCPLREGCQQRETFRKKARNLGARSVSFTCPILSARIRPGTRVVIRASYIGSSEHGEPMLLPVNVNATVTATTGGHRFACTVDPGQGIDDQFRFRRFQAHTRILDVLPEIGEVCGLGNVQQPGTGCDAKNGCACAGFAMPPTAPGEAWAASGPH